MCNIYLSGATREGFFHFTATEIYDHAKIRFMCGIRKIYMKPILTFLIKHTLLDDRVQDIFL